MFLEDDTLQLSPLSKKYKRRVKGPQNNILKPSYSFKRLREITKSSQIVLQDKGFSKLSEYKSQDQYLCSFLVKRQTSVESVDIYSAFLNRVSYATIV